MDDLKERLTKGIPDIDDDSIKERLKDSLFSIILFGSLPRGERTKGSDIDLFVVGNNLPVTGMIGLYIFILKGKGLLLLERHLERCGKTLSQWI